MPSVAKNPGVTKRRLAADASEGASGRPGICTPMIMPRVAMGRKLM